MSLPSNGGGSRAERIRQRNELLIDQSSPQLRRDADNKGGLQAPKCKWRSPTAPARRDQDMGALHPSNPLRLYQLRTDQANLGRNLG
jgi:hypothetical protein